MAVSRVSLSSITQGFPKSRSFLDGNSAYMPPSFESIATVTVGAGGSSSITFSSIPSTYKHLQIRGILRYSVADQMGMRLNSSTGTQAAHSLYGTGSSAAADSYVGYTQMKMFYNAVISGTANTFSALIIDILDYADTNKNKTIRVLGGYDANGSGNIILGSGGWFSTSAVNEVNFLLGQSAQQYSHFALYGVRG